MSSAALITPAAPRKIDLARGAVSPRRVFNHFLDGIVFLMAIIAVVPLFSVLYMVILEGAARIQPDIFTTLPPAAGMEGGGFGNAIVGTLVMVGIASAISVPLGILAAVFLTEYGKNNAAARIIQFAAKVLSGVPSVLMGVFIYAVVVVTMKSFSAVAGGLALAVLMLPIVILATEKALLQVPISIREASLGLGGTQAQTILRIVLPAATPSIITGVMLAVARAAGETAPVLFTALFSDYWLRNLEQPTASMAVLIYNYAGMPFENMVELAWAASLVLVLIVLITNVLSQLAASRR